MWTPCQKKLNLENFHHPCFGRGSWCFLAKKRKFGINKKEYICGSLKRKNEA